MERFPPNDIISLVGETPRFDLAESFGPNLRFSEVLNLLDRLEPGDMPVAYGTAEGGFRLRKAIADRHGVAPDDVVVTMGGAHALFLIAFVLCGPGTEAVTTAPLFPPARAALDAVGAQVNVLPLSFDRGYRIDLAELRGLLSPRTRLVSLASPQNPSGVAIPHETLAAILALMARICPEATLLVDETYREATYGEEPVADSALALESKVISVASLSKCHGAPGLRIGWAITRDTVLLRQLVLGKFNTVVSCSPIDERLAEAVLGEERMLSARRRRLAEARDRVEAWVGANSAFVDWVRPDAGALCCLRLKSSVFDDAAMLRFARELADAEVRVASGTWFGEEPRIFRLGFGLLAAPDLEAALAALAGALNRAARAVA